LKAKLLHLEEEYTSQDEEILPLLPLLTPLFSSSLSSSLSLLSLLHMGRFFLYLLRGAEGFSSFF